MVFHLYREFNCSSDLLIKFWFDAIVYVKERNKLNWKQSYRNKPTFFCYFDVKQVKKHKICDFLCLFG